MKTYSTKLGLGIALFIIIIIGGVSVQMLIEKQYWSFAINIIVFVLVYFLYKTTYYTIENNMLNVKSAFLINQDIDINTISKISETNNPMSAPAFSLDRLEVRYGKSESILISPKDKKGFIRHIKSINNKIEIIHKNKL